jgi:hypothetical protein
MTEKQLLDWHQRDDDTGRTYCGLDQDQCFLVADDPLDLSDGVTCESCLAAIEAEEEEEYDQ